MPTVVQSGDTEELPPSPRGPACFGCRKRSKKCDRTHPECRTCTVRGLRCEGYPPKYRFRLENSITCETPEKVLADCAATVIATGLPPLESTLNSSSCLEEGPCRRIANDDSRSARPASTATDLGSTENPRGRRPKCPLVSNLPAFVAPKDELLALPQSQRLLSYCERCQTHTRAVLTSFRRRDRL